MHVQRCLFRIPIPFPHTLLVVGGFLHHGHSEFPPSVIVVFSAPRSFTIFTLFKSVNHFKYLIYNLKEQPSTIKYKTDQVRGQQVHQSHDTTSFLRLPVNPLPLMVPPIARTLRLQPRILNREHILENPRLDHTLAEQLTAIARSGPQLLTRRIHGLPLPLQLKLVVASTARLVELPGAVNRPVAQETCSTEAEGARS